MSIEHSEQVWCPLTGQRNFKSANQAWDIYGQYRFAVSKRTFLTYVGKGKPCPPSPDGTLRVENIEIVAKSKGWPPAPSFALPSHKGGEGGAASDTTDYGAVYTREKALKEAVLRKGEELDYEKKVGNLIAREDYEQNLAAGAAIVASSAETFVYDSTREIIEICKGDPTKEDELREYMLERVRKWQNAFSAKVEYEVEFVEDDMMAGILPASMEDIQESRL